MPGSADRLIVDALGHLERAVEDRHAAFRTLQVASVGPEGRPGLRSVVLRRFEAASEGHGPTVEFWADATSGKIREIEFSAAVALLAWSAETALQLRLDGHARLHRGDALAHERWETLGEHARLAYGFARIPGTPIDDPDAPPRLATDRERFDRFAVIRVSVRMADALRLDGPAGQRRAMRSWPSTETATWVSP